MIHDSSNEKLYSNQVGYCQPFFLLFLTATSMRPPVIIKNNVLDQLQNAPSGALTTTIVSH